MAAIALERLTGTGTDPATGVDGVDLFVPEGEWLVLTGPAGGGTRVLLDLIAGTRLPASGRVLIDGCDVTEELADQRGLTFVQRAEEAPAEVPQASRSFEWFWRRHPPEPPPRPSPLDQFREALRSDEPGPRGPVLADDPLAAVDPAEADRVRVEVMDLHAARPRTVIHATANQEEALALGHRVGVMFAGRLVQVGPPLLVYERPATLAVARFVGRPAINLFEGSITLRQGRPVFEAGGQALTPLPAAAAPLAGRTVTLGVRPQDVELSPERSVVAGVIQAVEPIGPSQLVHVGLPGWQHLTALLPARPLLVAGSRVPIGFRPDRLHLFSEQGDRYAGLDRIAT